MSHFLNAVSIIREGLGYFKDAKLLYSEGRNIKEIYQKLTTTNVESKSELIDRFLANDIDYKDHVKIQGILIDYAHLYKPKSYINSLDKNNPVGETSEAGKYTSVFHWSWKPFQLPISKIPSVKIDSDLLSLSFLYPLDFESFIYEGQNSFVGGPIDEPTVKIPNQAKPIPIILSKEDAVKYQFQHVELTGRIVPLPENLIDQLIGNKFSSMVFSEIVNPLNSKTPSLCLTLETNKAHIRKVRNGITLSQCNASIFMETHIEGMASEKLIQKIPDLVSKSLTGKKKQYSLTYDDVYGDEDINLTNAKPTIFQLSSTTELKIIGKFPNILGFYLEGNLINLEDRYFKFVKEFNSFTANLYDMVPAFSLHIDFMHDFSLKNYFDSPLLSSKSTESIKDEEIQATIQWLKNQN